MGTWERLTTMAYTIKTGSVIIPFSREMCSKWHFHVSVIRTWIFSKHRHNGSPFPVLDVRFLVHEKTLIFLRQRIRFLRPSDGFKTWNFNVVMRRGTNNAWPNATSIRKSSQKAFDANKTVKEAGHWGGRERERHKWGAVWIGRRKCFKVFGGGWYPKVSTAVNKI